MGIWFLEGRADHDEIRFFDFKSNRATAIARLSRLPRSGLAISPDEHTVLYNQTDSFGTEILLMENFR
jgi:hypothetical protein